MEVWVEVQVRGIRSVCLVMEVIHKVVLEKVVVVGILSRMSLAHTKVSSRGIVVSLVSFLIQFFHDI